MKLRNLALATSLLFFSAIFALGFGGCGSVDVANLNPDDFSGGSVCDGVADDFETNVLPIFSNEGCAASSCHGASDTSGLSLVGTTQEVYDSATGAGRVNTADPANSDLLLKPLGSHPDGHTGGAPLDGVSDPSYITMFCWIEEGATLVDENPDDGGDDGGDTTTVEPTLTSIQAEVFDVSCATAGCHVSDTPAGSLDLSDKATSYAELVSVESTQEPPKVLVVEENANSSYLIEKLEGTNTEGDQMPANSSPLDESVIDVIRQWIDNGAENN